MATINLKKNEVIKFFNTETKEEYCLFSVTEMSFLDSEGIKLKKEFEARHYKDVSILDI
jgi:hypothetical protein